MICEMNKKLLEELKSLPPDDVKIKNDFFKLLKLQDTILDRSPRTSKWILK